MVNCTHRTTYQCLDELNAPKDEFLRSNASDNATISAKCSEAFYEFQVGESGDFDLSFVVSDLVKLKSVYIAGDYYPNLYSDGEWRCQNGRRVVPIVPGRKSMAKWTTPDVA